MFKEMNDACLEVQQLYDKYNEKQGEDVWNANDYLDGMMGDIGDLHKLIMAKNNKRAYKAKNHKDMPIDDAIAHELSDVFWSLAVIADKYKINLQDAVLKNMADLKAGIEEKLKP